MIDFHFDDLTRILTVQPKSALERADFTALAAAVDPDIEKHGDLTGLIIDAPAFPGWDGFGAMVTHLRFVRDHHRHVQRIAVVTDSPVGDLAEHLTSHFVAADVKHFPAGAVEAAQRWILGGGTG